MLCQTVKIILFIVKIRQRDDLYKKSKQNTFKGTKKPKWVFFIFVHIDILHLNALLLHANIVFHYTLLYHSQYQIFHKVMCYKTHDSQFVHHLFVQPPYRMSSLCGRSELGRFLLCRLMEETDSNQQKNTLYLEGVVGDNWNCRM